MMPGLKHAPKDGQGATPFTMAEIAECAGWGVVDVHDRIEDLAAKKHVGATRLERHCEVHAGGSQAGAESRVVLVGAGWCVRQLCWTQNTTVQYGFEPRPWISKLEFPVCIESRTRDTKLEVCLWDIVEALSQGRVVVVHCDEGFHRGPCGLVAIAGRNSQLTRAY